MEVVVERERERERENEVGVVRTKLGVVGREEGNG